MASRSRQRLYGCAGGIDRAPVHGAERIALLPLGDARIRIGRVAGAVAEPRDPRGEASGEEQAAERDLAGGGDGSYGHALGRAANTASTTAEWPADGKRRALSASAA
jgi:hypothetical protein